MILQIPSNITRLLNIDEYTFTFTEEIRGSNRAKMETQEKSNKYRISKCDGYWLM